jgi:non-heme chloroperoxidase
MLKKIIIGLLIICAIIFAAIQWQVYKINNAPEQFSLQTLTRPLNGTEEFVVCKDGTKLRTIIGGNGPLIVLAHGFGGTANSWSMIFNKLVKNGYKVIAIEQRGHYKSTIGTEGISSMSMANDYKTVLEHFNVQNAVLVGHSMGGFVGIKFLLEFPSVAKQRIKSVLLMSTFAGDINKDNSQNQMQIPLIKNGWINSVLNNQSLGTLFQASIIAKPDKAIVQTALHDIKLQDLSTLTPILEAFINENYYGRLKEITIPSTILVGSEDKTAPGFHSVNLQKGINNSKLVTLGAKGHLLNWEAPDQVYEQIENLAK